MSLEDAPLARPRGLTGPCPASWQPAAPDAAIFQTGPVWAGELDPHGGPRVEAIFRRAAIAITHHFGHHGPEKLPM
ncbi:hypothetical protein [Roseivivax sp. CAU 1761]